MTKVKFKKDGLLATVSIDREERLNSMDYETLIELEKVIEKLKFSKDIRVVVFTGAGEKAFSAGADLKERKNLNDQQVRRNVQKTREVINHIELLPLPTIAAINGFALGGGLELALVCDFRIAADHAQMGLTEVSWGIVPGAGGTQRLARLIGVSKAKELILTARKIDSETAYSWGMINKRVNKNELQSQVNLLVNEITSNAPLAVNQAKIAIQQGSDTDLHTGLAIESKAYEAIIQTEDRIEALNAFQDKRPPQFQGK
ncbi:enoyl-CoA hydratase-related protein [Halobacillus rhizosphaerae]|uniref:enoyl-CoA hydratase-related protein n=1 Tax=Halobacillus rhizosphaerae TaxID=3064889 RepID=UPI00398A977E